MRYVAIASLFLVSTLAALTVRADDSNDPYIRKGGYVGVGGTYGLQLMENSFDDTFNPVDADTSNSWGAHVTAGYRFSKWISTEVEYEWMNNFNTQVGGVALVSLEMQTATMNLKITAPYRQLQPYFLVGAGASWVTADKHFFFPLDFSTPSFTARFGVGLDYYFTPSFYMNAGTDVLVNTARISTPGGGNGRGLDYLAFQFGFGYRF
jgi:Outer membrane protein beta-barrel domain